MKNEDDGAQAEVAKRVPSDAAAARVHRLARTMFDASSDSSLIGASRLRLLDFG